jgi:hypothetical protein
MSGSHGFAQQGGYSGAPQAPGGTGPPGSGHQSYGSSTSYNSQGQQSSLNYGAQQPWEHNSPAPPFPSVPSPNPQPYSPHKPGEGISHPWSSAPPPIPPRIGPPTIPNRPAVGADRETDSTPIIIPQGLSQVGAIYAPGTYPTPELFNFPLGKHTVLHSPEYGFTAKSIQHQLDQLGSNSTLYLPRGSRWEVEAVITMHPYQELATEGYPNAEYEMAWLEAKEELHLHLISGFGKSGVRLRNILFEGNREKFGHDPDGRCMILLGDTNTCNQVSCAAHEPFTYLKH